MVAWMTDLMVSWMADLMVASMADHSVRSVSEIAKFHPSFTVSRLPFPVYPSRAVLHPPVP